MMTRSVCAITIAATLLGPAASLAEDAAMQPPNVLLIMTDDQGYGDITSHGNPQVDTPVLDQLASDGARFERFMVSPMCAPTRAALLTGRFPLRTGVFGVTRGQETIRPDETTLGELFKDAGYATGIFGKWHSGEHFPYSPNGRGFDEFIGFTAGHWENYFDPDLLRNRSMVATQGYITDVLTDAALDFMKANAESPFFCYLPYNAPHGPWQLPDRYFDKYKARRLDDTTASAYGMVENLDDNIGRLMDYLDQAGLAENTVVLFLTDNGPNSDRYNANMRGRKGDVHEGGVRVPLFVRWPGHVAPGQVINELTAHVDILPTLQAACGLGDSPKPLDGRSLLPLIDGTASAAWPDRKLFYHAWSRGAVRTDRWRAIKDDKQPWELYDMLADPSQKHNVASIYPAVMANLSEAYDGFVEEVGLYKMRSVPIPVGHPEAPVVTAPSHEAKLHGEGIRYVTDNGWAGEWITRWTSIDAFPEWTIDVTRPGRYTVALQYACEPTNQGAVFEVAIGDSTQTITVDQPVALEKVNANDRVRKQKKYVTGWGLTPPQDIHLEAGIQRLRVQPKLMPGAQLILLKGVRVERVDRY